MQRRDCPQDEVSPQNPDLVSRLVSRLSCPSLADRVQTVCLDLSTKVLLYPQVKVGESAWICRDSARPSSRGRVKPLLGRFSELQVLLSDLRVKPGSVDAVLLDAGCSSMQMDQAERGFSLSKDGPLDMRMDGER